MVKMVLGSSDTQASSVGTLADNYKAGFEQLVKSIDQLANEDRLSGSAYSNIKNYGSSVVKPLAQAFVLLAEAAKADIKKLPDEYRASVGNEDLDEETLTAQIHALNSTLATNRATKTAMKRIDSAADTQSFDQAISADEGTKRDLEEKLRKLREYNAKSSGFFSDIAGLESAVNTGLSQLQSGISGFNGTFTLPSKKELAWTKTINKEYKQYQHYQSAVIKAEKGEKLTEEEAKAVEAYKKKHPGLTIDKSVIKAADKKMSRVKEKEQYEAVVKKAKNGEKLTNKDVQILTAYAQSHPNAKVDINVVKAIKDYVNKVKNHYDKNSTKYDIYANVVEQLGLGVQRLGGLVSVLGGIKGPATVDAKGVSTAFVLVNKNGVGQALARNGSKIASVGKWGGKALVGLGFGLGMFDDIANNGKSVGQATVHNGLSTGISWGAGAGTAALAAVALGSNPVGWAAAGVAAAGVAASALASLGFETAYKNNFLGLQDSLDTAGKWVDNAGKNVGKAVSDSVDGTKNWAKDTAGGVGSAISGGLSALNPFD
ncbi:T7SS effector LXG polymorphic toxin [Streptococcus macacae]|uniref:LXG domain-containing protein n=1 Tax=Streptococcus macacae NCTC 11558 TaxID=764298 RepID=G5JX78_9STRE|nr:T7SS effector LXG polymorphic toxin [Streptococcus macacae]EHJ52041.1 hypothetical protein STRMA_1947 [Streptococcus macacae NCTC 11558]SUN77851.1 membrane protein [Streptococcus macacae NCTC 11558]